MYLLFWRTRAIEGRFSQISSCLIIRMICSFFHGPSTFGTNKQQILMTFIQDSIISRWASTLRHSTQNLNAYVSTKHHPGNKGEYEPQQKTMKRSQSRILHPPDSPRRLPSLTTTPPMPTKPSLRPRCLASKAALKPTYKALTSTVAGA